MAIIQRSTDKLSEDFNYANAQQRKVRRGTRRRRRRQRRHVTKAMIIMMGMVLAWVIGICIFFLRYSGLVSIPTQPSSNMKSTGGIIHRSDNGSYESPLLIFTCRRPKYLSTTLENVFASISDACAFGCPIIISEDGNHKEIEDVVVSYTKKFEEKGIPLIHIHHERGLQLKGNAYEALSKHYGWALSEVFDGRAYSLNEGDKQQHILPQRVIILEEDIKVAPDFFSFMESTSSLLDNDPTLYAVSAFNDNGHLENGDPRRLLRSDFFPGLGWMMNRDLWKNELESKWPNAYWDDWLREVAQRKDRQVIRPEVSRTYHFGTKGGASGNQFGSILGRVELNENAVQWDMEDLTYLDNSKYQNQYMELVMKSKLIHSLDHIQKSFPGSNVRMEYENFAHFSVLANQLGIMEDEKALVPRTAYRGIVEARLGSNLLFLIPKGGFKGYRKD